MKYKNLQMFKNYFKYLKIFSVNLLYTSKILNITIILTFSEILSQYPSNFPLAFLRKLEYTNQ